ncbi:MAG: serpin family protein [Clostridia bacterium]|nr:serpin family protein [Clostridia bacterium]
MKRILALLLLPALLCACVTADASADLMVGITPGQVTSAAAESADAAAMASLALTLLRDEAVSGGNALISPLSIFAALGMTANGAAGNTLAQMETVLGLSRERLGAVMAALPRDGDATLHLANGIWLRDHDLTVSPAFLQANADYYGAAARLAAMTDDTRREVNAFIEEETAGMIKNMLEKGTVTDDTVMLLVNALAFEAEWSSVYYRSDVHAGDFTTADGETVKADYMYSAESKYLADDRAQGFIKYYKGRDYAFAAILPNADISLDDYLAGLEGTKLIAMLENAESTMVQAALPKFSYSSTYLLNSALARAGMTDAFDTELADFSAMAESPRGNIFLDYVLHKTYIEVAEQGTRAGAATVVAASDGAAIAEPRQVYLTRPFLYLIIDTASNLPVFIGRVANPS